MFCPKCGKETAGDPTFCSSCGFKLNQWQPAKKTPSEPRRFSMSAKARACVGTALGVFVLLHQLWLFMAFPVSRDLAFALAFIPFMALVLAASIGVGIAASLLLKSARTKKRAFFIVAAFILATILLQLLAFPSGEGEEGPIGQTFQYVSVFSRYPAAVEYEDIVSANRAERAAARVKFESDLPDAILVFEFVSPTTIGRPEEQFLVSYSAGVPSYDSSQIQLVNSAPETLLVITHPNDPEKREEHSIPQGDVAFALQFGVGIGGPDTAGGGFMILSFHKPDYGSSHNTRGDDVFVWALRTFK